VSDGSETGCRPRCRHGWGTSAGVAPGAVQINSILRCTIRIMITAFKSAGIICQGCGRLIPPKLNDPPSPPRNPLFLPPPFANKYLQINKLTATPHIPTSKQRPPKQGLFGQITPLNGPKPPQNGRFLIPLMRVSPTEQQLQTCMEHAAILIHQTLPGIPLRYLPAAAGGRSVL